MGSGLFYRPITGQSLFINRDGSAKIGKLSSEFGQKQVPSRNRAGSEWFSLHRDYSSEPDEATAFEKDVKPLTLAQKVAVLEQVNSLSWVYLAIV